MQTQISNMAIHNVKVNISKAQYLNLLPAEVLTEDRETGEHRVAASENSKRSIAGMTEP